MARITQAEPSVLHRFQAAVGLGQVYGPYKGAGGREYYAWQLQPFEKVQAVIAMLWNWVSGPKQKQMEEALRGYHEERTT